MIRRTKPWSKLQKRLYNIIADEIDLQIHCVVYSMNSNYGSTGLPRYFITLGKEIIWDYPADFTVTESDDETLKDYPHITGVSAISDLIEEYVNTRSDELTEKIFVNDLWNFIDILKAADRRMRKRRLEILKEKTENEAIKKIIEKRMNIT